MEAPAGKDQGRRKPGAPSSLKCSTCQATFRRPEHLKRHLRSHTKEKPFQCNQCSRRFSRRYRETHSLFFNPIKGKLIQLLVIRFTGMIKAIMHQELKENSTMLIASPSKLFALASNAHLLASDALVVIPVPGVRVVQYDVNTLLRGAPNQKSQIERTECLTKNNIIARVNRLSRLLKVTTQSRILPDHQALHMDKPPSRFNSNL